MSTERNESSLKKRATAAEFQMELHLNEIDYANFVDFAKKVHQEMRTAHPHWGDMGCVWDALPTEERTLALAKMLERCSSLLQARGNDLASSSVRSAIDARLYQTRRNWILNRQKVLRKNDVESSPSTSRNVMTIGSILDPP